MAAQLTGRGGGIPLVGPNAQLFPKMHFEGPPYYIAMNLKLELFVDLASSILLGMRNQHYCNVLREKEFAKKEETAKLIYCKQEVKIFSSRVRQTLNKFYCL